MVRACRAIAIAVRTLLSLPNEICSGTRVPASFIRPRCSATSRPFWISSTMSTSFSWVSWGVAHRVVDRDAGRRQLDHVGRGRIDEAQLPICVHRADTFADVERDRGELL